MHILIPSINVRNVALIFVFVCEEFFAMHFGFIRASSPYLYVCIVREVKRERNDQSNEKRQNKKIFKWAYWISYFLMLIIYEKKSCRVEIYEVSLARFVYLVEMLTIIWKHLTYTDGIMSNLHDFLTISAYKYYEFQE